MSKNEVKQFSGWEIKDEALGSVEACVMTLNEVDHGADVVLPGAIKDGSTVKISSFGHSVITEGAPPVGAGVVHVVGNRAILKGRYFLNTQAGREAFETVKALGPGGCEWSTGFRVTRTAPMTREWREKGAERLIAEMWLGECSPVFVGESRSTATLAVKSQDADEQRELAAIVQAHQQRELQLIAANVAAYGAQSPSAPIVGTDGEESADVDHVTREMRAIAKRHEQRGHEMAQSELRAIRNRLDYEPDRADHRVPCDVAKHLRDVATFACKYFGLRHLDVRYYERQSWHKHVGFFRKSEPHVVWVAAGRPAEQMALTLAHEAAHAGGIDDEDAADQSAKNMLKAWLAQRPIAGRIEAPLFDHAA